MLDREGALDRRLVRQRFEQRWPLEHPTVHLNVFLGHAGGREAGHSNIPQRPDCVAGHVGLELRNVGANYPFEGRANSRESSRIPATETVRVLSCGCNSGLNIREDSRTIAFDISMAAAAPGPAGLCGRAKQAAQSRAA